MQLLVEFLPASDVQYALGVAEVGPDKVFVDLNEFGFVVTEADVDLGADGLVTAVPRRFEWCATRLSRSEGRR
jgi:hypothetical protein